MFCRLKTVAPLAFAFLLAACAGAPERKQAAVPERTRPAWVDGEPGEYPRALYLTGVGSADDQGAARDRARGEIARVFSSRITVNSAVVSSEYSAVSGGRTETSSSQDVSQNVRTATSKELEGVEIADAWRDGGTGTYYALAVLDRAKAAAVLGERLRGLEADAAEEDAQLTASTAKLQRAKHALKTLELLKAAGTLTSELRVLRPDEARPQGPAEAQRRHALQALSALDVVLLMPDRSEAVSASVISALNSLGLEARTAGSPSGADLAAECSVKFEEVPDIDPRSRWKWSRGTAAVSLKDVKTSRVFLNFDSTVKEASSTPEGARFKAETALGKKTGEEVLRGIAAYLAAQ